MPYIVPPVLLDPMEPDFTATDCAGEKDWFALRILNAEHLWNRLMRYDYKVTIATFEYRHFFWLNSTNYQVKIGVRWAQLVTQYDTYNANIGALFQLILQLINELDCSDPNWRAKADAIHQYLRELMTLIQQFTLIVKNYRNWIETDAYVRGQ